MEFSSFRFILLFIFVFQLANHVKACWGVGSCDWYKGSWVYDTSLPLYDNNTCPSFIRKFINCQKNGRPDTDYLKYRWQPAGCNLSRFDGLDFLKRYHGKHIMFVGDSLSIDQYESLTCLLHSAVPNMNYTNIRTGDISTLTITGDYEITLSIDVNHFFVDIIKNSRGTGILSLDSIQDGKNWLGVDMLIFNTYHWWWYKKPQQPWDYVKDGDKIYKDIDRMYAMKRALGTWAKWVDANVDTNKTRVFFQGVSPDHYHGVDWGQPHANCKYQKEPILGSKYSGPYSTVPMKIINSTLTNMRTPVTLLDITWLSLFRKDGHPSIYGQTGAKGDDCTHWCLAGVPDTWNQIMYNIIISEGK